MSAITCTHGTCQDLQFHEHAGPEADQIAETHNRLWHGGGQYATAEGGRR